MGFGIDMAKARNIHKQNIRFSRGEKFVELDIEFQRAMETNDTTKQAEIAAKKQALRDAPSFSGFEWAADIDALKAKCKTDLLG